MIHPIVPWLFLALSVFGAALTYNSYRPVHSPAAVAGVSFFAGWLTGELPMHHVFWQCVVVLGFVHEHALATLPGKLALAITAASWVGLFDLARRSSQAAAVVDKALGDALGEPYHAWIAGDLPRELAPTREWKQLVFPLPVRHGGVERVRDVTYFRDGRLNLRLDVHRARGTVPALAPVLVYVHGGAWMIGTKGEQGLPLMQHLAARGWVCVGIDYRLSPRATFPDPLVDVKRALAWVREHIAEYGGDPDFVMIAGGSAGGHLASLAALTGNDPRFQPGFERARTDVQGCLSFYGIYDFEDHHGHWPNPGLRMLLERFVMKQSLADAPDAYALASPLRHVASSAPPFLVIQGSHDTLVPVEEARRFVSALRAVSHAPVVYVEVPGAQHAFEIFPSLRTMAVVKGAARFATWVRVNSRLTPTLDRARSSR